MAGGSSWLLCLLLEASGSNHNERLSECLLWHKAHIAVAPPAIPHEWITMVKLE